MRSFPATHDAKPDPAYRRLDATTALSFVALCVALYAIVLGAIS